MKKARTNLTKHGVSFHEALTVFADPLARIFPDEPHTARELREIIIGHSVQLRLLIVCFTERDSGIRIFSARVATRQERRDYEDNT